LNPIHFLCQPLPSLDPASTQPRAPQDHSAPTAYRRRSRYSPRRVPRSGGGGDSSGTLGGDGGETKVKGAQSCVAERLGRYPKAGTWLDARARERAFEDYWRCLYAQAMREARDGSVGPGDRDFEDGVHDALVDSIFLGSAVIHRSEGSDSARPGSPIADVGPLVDQTRCAIGLVVPSEFAAPPPDGRQGAPDRAEPLFRGAEDQQGRAADRVGLPPGR